jgi:hypothetical protein
MKIVNRYFENVSQFKYLGMIATNKNLIREEIKRSLNSGNACYYSVQTLLSSRLLSKNLKIRKYTRLWFCLWFCLGVKLGWSLALTEENRLIGELSIPIYIYVHVACWTILLSIFVSTELQRPSLNSWFMLTNLFIRTTPLSLWLCPVFLFHFAYAWSTNGIHLICVCSCDCWMFGF